MFNIISISAEYSKLYLNRYVLLFFLVFISFTDFFSFISKVFYFPVLLVFVIYMYSLIIDKKLKQHIIFYGLSLLSLVLMFFLKRGNINGLIFIPVFVFFTYVIVCRSIKKECMKVIFDCFLKLIVLFLLAVSFFEILTKLNMVSFSYYSDFINNYGDMRFDVLRTRVLWGSALSSASVGIFLMFYFSLVRKDFTFLFLTFFYIILTGSRTAIVLFILMLFVSLIKSCSFWSLRLSRKTFFSLISLLPFVMLAFVWLLDSSVGRIVNRAFTIKADASFSGRENTTGAVLEKLLASLPESLFWGLTNTNWISDSAFTSIAAQSGILPLCLFLGYLCFLLFKSSLDYITKITVFIVSILGGWTIGDFFIPAVTFLYTLTFLIYEKNTTYYYRFK